MRQPVELDLENEKDQTMKKASEIERVMALREILKFKKDGGRRDHALALAKLIFQQTRDRVVSQQLEVD